MVARIVAILVSLPLFVVACPAVAGSTAYNFSGPYGPARWTTTLTGVPPGGGLPVGIDASGAPSTMTVLGGDGVPPGRTDCWDDNLPTPRKGCAIFHTITAGSTGTVTFDWAYESFDNSSGATFDVFGYVVNGAMTQVTSDGGANIQSGAANFGVLAGQTFGFWLDCGDCGYGNAVVTIRGFSAPVADTAAIPTLGIAELAVLSVFLAILAMTYLRRA